MHERHDIIVIGAGQAGLATGYHLAHQGVDFLILDRHQRVGESWRRRWDSLRLFTPARMDGLPGMAFPAPPDHRPSKDEVADFLEGYAERMRLPMRLGVTVERLTDSSAGGHGFDVTTDHGTYRAERVIVASGAWHEPRVPPFAAQLDDGVLQLHSSELRSVSQLQSGSVLVVGGANSGAEIAAMAAPDHETWLVGRDTGQMPFDIDARVADVAASVVWFAANHVVTVRNPIGRRAIAAMRDHGSPLERVRKRDLESAGVKRIYARVSGTQDGLPVLADGRVLPVRNVVWATGFRHDLPWIQLSDPVVGADGWPAHRLGVSTRVAGLYFVGLPYQTSFASALLGGVGRDAEHIATSCVQASHGLVRSAAPA